MKLFSVIILVLLFAVNYIDGQTRTITGKAIDEKFDPIYGAKIFSSDTILLGMTGTDGNFKIDIPIQTNSLIVAAPAYEWKSINLPMNCDHLELIILNWTVYDFMSSKKIDRLRLKDFKKLPELHREAFKKGLFLMERPCYEEKFTPRYNR